MSNKTREELKDIFITGAKPKEIDFHDWLDNFMHRSDAPDLSTAIRAQAIEPQQANFWVKNTYIPNTVSLKFDGAGLRMVQDPGTFYENNLNISRGRTDYFGGLSFDNHWKLGMHPEYGIGGSIRFGLMRNDESGLKSYWMADYENTLMKMGVPLGLSSWVSAPSVVQPGTIGFNSATNKMQLAVGGAWKNIASEDSTVLNQMAVAQDASSYITGTSYFKGNTWNSAGLNGYGLQIVRGPYGPATPAIEIIEMANHGMIVQRTGTPTSTDGSYHLIDIQTTLGEYELVGTDVKLTRYTGATSGKTIGGRFWVNGGNPTLSNGATIAASFEAINGGVNDAYAIYSKAGVNLLQDGVKTGAPTANGADNLKIGKVITGTSTTITTDKFLEIKSGTTVYKIPVII